jgi:hypothetical protein
MKKTIFLLPLLTVSTLAMAQKKTTLLYQGINTFSGSNGIESVVYDFSLDNATYAPLTGATNLATSYPWDDPTESLPIGFTFESAFGMSLTELNFGLSTAGAVSNNYSFPTSNPRIVFAPYDADLIDRGYISGVTQSAIRHKTDGTAPNRIFKLEWENAGFYGEYDSLNQLNDFVNVQLWLYETSGIIEFRYGPSSIQNPIISFEEETGPLVGIADFDFVNETFFDLAILVGPAATPTVVANENDIDELIGTPPNGMIYRFTPVILSAEKSLKYLGAAIYPNPVANVVKIDVPLNAQKSHYQMSDITGKIIAEGTLTSGKNQVDVSGLPKGMYLFSLSVDGKTATERIVK